MLELENYNTTDPQLFEPISSGENEGQTTSEVFEDLKKRFGLSLDREKSEPVHALETSRHSNSILSANQGKMFTATLFERMEKAGGFSYQPQERIVVTEKSGDSQRRFVINKYGMVSASIESKRLFTGGWVDVETAADKRDFRSGIFELYKDILNT
jgi:hypothetical protein